MHFVSTMRTDCYQKDRMHISRIGLCVQIDILVMVRTYMPPGPDLGQTSRERCRVDAFCEHNED